MINRIDIELAILSAIIYCDGFAKVAHVLSHKNFTSSPSVKNSELFQAISRLFPDRPIDLISVSEEVKKNHDNYIEVLSPLLDYRHSVAVSSNVEYWAYILLQIDITDKYKRQLIEWKEQRERELEHTEVGVLREVIEFTADPQQDIFQIIEKSILYFEQMGMKAEFDEATQYFKDISVKAQQIKKVNSIHVALRYLFAITECGNIQVRNECNRMAMAIADMITTGQTNPRYTEAVNIIYQ